MAQIISASNEGKLKKAIQDGRGASLCPILVHAAFQLIDPSNAGAMPAQRRGNVGTLSRSVVLKALRDSEDVRTLLQLLQAIQQEAGVCLVFEKARRAIERAGSQSITLAEFEAHLVPAQQQRRKPSLPVRLLTGLSLSLVQGLSLYVIAAHAGLVSSPVAAAARASIGTGGEPPQWDTAAVQAVQAVRGAGARAVAAAATAADPGAHTRSWSEGVQVGIKSDDAAAAAAPPKMDPNAPPGSPDNFKIYNVYAREWAHGDEHSARLLAERNANPNPNPNPIPNPDPNLNPNPNQGVSDAVHQLAQTAPVGVAHAAEFNCG